MLEVTHRKGYGADHESLGVISIPAKTSIFVDRCSQNYIAKLDFSEVSLIDPPLHGGKYASLRSDSVSIAFASRINIFCYQMYTMTLLNF